MSKRLQWRNLAVPLFVLLSLLSTISCRNERAVPLESRLYLQQTYNPQEKTTDNRLLLLFRVASDKHIKNIATAVLFHQSSELYWAIDSSDLKKNIESGEYWLASSSISPAWGEDFPKGNYELYIENYDGESDRIVLTLNQEIGRKLPEIPKLMISDGELRIEPALQSSLYREIHCLDISGNLKKVFQVAGNSILLKELRSLGTTSIVISDLYNDQRILNSSGPWKLPN